MRAGLFFLVAVSCNLGFSQDLKEQFERTKKSQLQSFDQFRRKNDSTFARFILDTWHEVKFNTPLNDAKESKPSEAPQFIDKGQKPEFKSWEDIAVDTVVYLKVDEPEKLESLAYYPEINNVNFDYWGADVNVRYPSELTHIQLKGSAEKRLGDYWLQASQTNYQVLITDLLSNKDAYNLPDYAFYLMVKSFVERSGAEEAQQVYQTWFLMSKASYTCKIGFANGRPVFLLGVNGSLYGKPYFTERGIRYYAMDKVDARLYTYKDPVDSGFKPLDFSVKSAVNLPIVAASRTFSFKYADNLYELEFFYNRNSANLLSLFPDSDLRNYLNSSASRLLQKSLHKTLDPLMRGLSDSEKVKLLLSFVQSMPYQKDEEQFGKEKIFYPDEFLAHEFSDCDDRVVFMTYLIKELVGLEVIAVTFPRHVALAVKLAFSDYGENVTYNGSNYSFCDPTYVGAPIGAVIPQADFSRAKIIPIQ